MSKIDDGGPAFPVNELNQHDGKIFNQHMGLTLRDYFAAKAMQVLISKSDGQSKTGGKAGVPLIACYAYEFADAMLATRKEE